MANIRQKELIDFLISFLESSDFMIMDTKDNSIVVSDWVASERSKSVIESNMFNISITPVEVDIIVKDKK
jgi:hypothetical protein